MSLEFPTKQKLISKIQQMIQQPTPKQAVSWKSAIFVRCHNNAAKIGLRSYVVVEEVVLFCAEHKLRTE